VEDEPNTLQVTWSSDRDGGLGAATADMFGRASAIATDLEAGEHTITMTVTDTDGMNNSASFSLVVNQPPTRPDVSLSPIPATTSDDLLATIDIESVDPEGESISYTYAWSRDGETSLFSTSDRLSAEATTKGQRWTIEVTPNDGDADGPPATATIDVLNTAPNMASVEITPSTPATADTLLCTASADADTDSDDVTFSYEWFVNDVSIGETSSSLLPILFSSGDQVSCEVTPHDGEVSGASLRSTAVTINVPPVVHSVHITPGTPTGGDALFCNVGSTTDLDDDPIEVQISWTINDIEIGETGTVLDDSFFVRDDHVACTATANDGIEDGESVMSEPITILNTIPVLLSAAISPTEPISTDTLVCAASGASDGDDDPISVHFEWVINGLASGHTGDTLDAAGFGPGDIIECEATPQDDIDSGDPVRSASVQINVPPVVHSVHISPTEPTVEDVLTCNEGAVTDGDGDGDPVSTTVRWFINGIDIGSDSRTLEGSWLARDDEVHCSITPFDGIEDGESVTSDPVTVLNTPPIIHSASISPTEPISTDTLVCTASGTSDGDDDPVIIHFEWVINGLASGHTGDTLDAAGFGPGDIIECDATPQDDIDSGDSVRSASVQINVPPVIHSVYISPTEPTVEDVLTCNEGVVTDGDGDPVSTTGRWFINGIDIGSDSSTLEGSWLARDDEVHCSITPFDGVEHGIELEAETITVRNAQPRIVSLDVGPSDASTSSMLTVTVTATDSDLDATTLHYAWFVNGVPAGTDASTLDGVTHFSRDDLVTVTVTASDGIDDSTPVSSDEIVIANTPPTSPTVVIHPTDPAAGQDDLVCSIDAPASDEDGDTISYIFSWTVDDVPFGTTEDSTYPDDTISGFETSADQVWACTVTASDGTDGADTASDSVVPEWRFSGWGDEPFELEEASAHLYGTRATEQAGTSLASAGDIDGDGLVDIMVGAPANDDVTTNSGKAYITLSSHYMGSSAALLEDAHQVIEGDQVNSGLGKGLAGNGTIAGTDTPDIAIGAHNHDLFVSDEGIVAVFFDGGELSDDPLRIDDADAILHGATDGEQAGYDIHFVDDMDGDGRTELLVGAPRYDGPGAWSGAAYLVLGSAIASGGTIDLDDSTRMIGETGLDRAGDKVQPAGDIDGDGITDILISAPFNEEGGAKAGRVYIISGDAALTFPTLLLTDADYKFHGENAQDQAGYAIDGDFDADGDGIADILIGAPLNDTLDNESGRAYLVFGSHLSSIDFIGLSEADVIFTCDEDDAQLGASLSAESDVDNDGLADVLIGIPNSHAGATDSGSAVLFQGEFLVAGGVFAVEDANTTFYGVGANDHAGKMVLGLGDVDGDTFDDIAIAEPNDGTLSGNAGLIHILFAP
jgi:hypothetical protein